MSSKQAAAYIVFSVGTVRRRVRGRMKRVHQFVVGKRIDLEVREPGDPEYQYERLTGAGPNEPTDFLTASRRRTRALETGRTD